MTTMIFRQVQRTVGFCFNKFRCWSDRLRRIHVTAKYIWKHKEKEVEHTITWKKLHQSNTCQRRSGLCNWCIEEKVEILLSKAKPSTQLNRRFEVSTCRHVSPPTSIAPTSKPIKTEPNRPLHLSEDHRRHRRM